MLNLKSKLSDGYRPGVVLLVVRAWLYVQLVLGAVLGANMAAECGATRW